MIHEDGRSTDGSCPNKVGAYTDTFKKMDLSAEEIERALERQKACVIPEDREATQEAFTHCINHPGYTTLVVGVGCDGLPSDDGQLCTSMAIAGPDGSFPATSVLMAIEMLSKTVTHQMIGVGQSPTDIQEQIISAVRRGVRGQVVEMLGPIGLPSNPLMAKLKDIFDGLKVKDLPQKDQPFKDLEA